MTLSEALGTAHRERAADYERQRHEEALRLIGKGASLEFIDAKLTAQRKKDDADLFVYLADVRDIWEVEHGTEDEPIG
ncbi:MAG TPA: hypothetical protein VGF24_33170 [Vicinamibacterales bacterium]|jgi:hypothetical protein